MVVDWFIILIVRHIPSFKKHTKKVDMINWTIQTSKVQQGFAIAIISSLWITKGDMQQILHNMDSTQLKHMLVNLNHFSKCQGKKKRNIVVQPHRWTLFICHVRFSLLCWTKTSFQTQHRRIGFASQNLGNKGDLMWFCRTFFEEVETRIERRVTPPMFAN